MNNPLAVRSKTEEKMKVISHTVKAPEKTVIENGCIYEILKDLIKRAEGDEPIEGRDLSESLYGSSE